MFSFQLATKKDRLRNDFNPSHREKTIDWRMVTIHFINQAAISPYSLHRSKINRLKNDLYPFHRSNIFSEQRMIDYWLILPPFIDQRATDLKIVPYHFIYQKWWFEESFSMHFIEQRVSILLFDQKNQMNKVFYSFITQRKIDWEKISIQFIVKEQSNEEW